MNSVRVEVASSSAPTRFGIGFRQEVGAETIERIDAFDCLEIVTDQFVHRPRGVLAKLAEHVPVIPHGVGLSLGSVLPPDREYLKKLKEICRLVEAPFYGEHLSLNLAPGIDVGHLAPVPLGGEALGIVRRNVTHVQDVLGIPLCIENITYGFNIGSTSHGLEQADMLSDLVATTGCSLLLDIANLYINAANHGFEPSAFVERLPKNAIAQIHLAGGVKHRSGRLIDSHNRSVDDDVWELYEQVMREINPAYVIIERDADFPEIGELISEVERARSLGAKIIDA